MIEKNPALQRGVFSSLNPQGAPLTIDTCTLVAIFKSGGFWHLASFKSSICLGSEKKIPERLLVKPIY